MNTVNRGRGLMSFVVIGTMLLALIGLTTFSTSTAQAQTTCGNPFLVQSGDTLSTIANACSTTVNALLKANPQISNSNQLTIGERIYIPGRLGIRIEDDILITDDGCQVLTAKCPHAPWDA